MRHDAEEMSAKQKIGVAVLNWNGYEDTAQCLISLRKSEVRPGIVLVFDNGSTDGSAARLKAEFPEIELMLSGDNLGFAEGNNRAVRRLLDAGMEYVWILNNDTKVEPDCLGALVRVLEGDPAVGAVSAKIWFMVENKPLCYAGATFDRWTFNTRFRGLRELDVGQYDVAEDADVFSGCCMLIRAEVVRRIGLFNRAFFAYAEDIDWSLRALEAGIRQRYEPRATLWHKMYGSSNKEGSREIPKSSSRVEFLLSRNRFILVRLHTKPWSVRRGFALVYHIFVRRLPRAAGLLLLPGRRTVGIGILKGLWAGLWVNPDPGACRP